MPLAIITYDPKNHEIGKCALKISEILPGIIAKTLSIPNHPHASLSENDTEVLVREYLVFDKNTPTIGIQIFANDYPERKENLEERNKKIVEFIKQSNLLPYGESEKFYVWTMLFPGAFDIF